MKKISLIILIIGLVIILAIAAGVSVRLLKQAAVQPPAATPGKTTLTAEEEKTLAQWLGANPDEIPDAYKEKVELFKDQLENKCLAKKQNVRQFLSAGKNDAEMENLLNEMKEITIPLDWLPSKTSPQVKDLDFEMHKYAVLECLNLNKEDFQQCQSKLNGLEINNKNAEETVLAKMNDSPGSLPVLPAYLQCKAVKQKDKNLCSKSFFPSILNLNDCQEIVGRLNFMTSVYSQPNCENLCQKEKVTIDKEFTAGDCLTLCQAIKNSDANECLKFQDKNKELRCNAYAALDSNSCQKIEPKILESKDPNGTVIKEDQAADCLSLTLAFKSIKENNPDILKGAEKSVRDNVIFSFDFLNYLKRVYFDNEDCEKNFDKLYENYCDLKYNP